MGLIRPPQNDRVTETTKNGTVLVQGRSVEAWDWRYTVCNGNCYEGSFKIVPAWPWLTQTIVASDSKQLSVFDLKNVSLSKCISFENNFPFGLDKHKNNAKMYDG